MQALVTFIDSYYYCILLKVYLAVPIVNNRDSGLAKNIAHLLNDLGCDIISAWILWDDPNPNLDAKAVYERDYNAIKSCDCLIAEVSRPSIGVGMEIMLANTFGKKIICLYSKTKISNFLKGMPRIKTISYNDMNDLATKLPSMISEQN